MSLDTHKTNILLCCEIRPPFSNKIGSRKTSNFTFLFYHINTEDILCVYPYVSYLKKYGTEPMNIQVPIGG